ncbi:MAG TPA: HAMP domain-containing histidine kinase [Candidatus Eisenbergiella merdipullorum]|uniref:histidine kinase n=1 Tax=Candidatus Eisenbergiella merdipullorum TaxID=2838553 RepID=A0A9D2I332_9FIRM|nr:HAMP domain-containing histidine kinase [Candidatus Eisenbergiella merdipullorum]
MRYSIRKQFAGIFIGLMAGTLLLCWFINSTFLERFYFHNKQRVVMEAYEQLNEAAQNGNISSDDFNVHLQQLSATYNISILILDEDSETIRVSGGDPSMLRADLWNHIIFDSYEDAGEKNAWQQPQVQTGGTLRTNRVLARNESPFYLLQLVTSLRVNMDYMDMWGFLDNNNLFFIRTAMESIRDSTDISNRFLAYVGIAATLICGVVIWMVSKKITEPILELARISERMTHLDFDARYEGKSFNEIAVLGNHMNELADALENTISELKTANNELQKDIEKKDQIDGMRREFLANVSHELKTPIALIQGYAEGLKEGVNDDEESRNFYCDVIMDESAKMNNMVKKLLTLNELEFGNDVVTMERFDIVALIRNYIQSADILIKQNEATVRFEETEPVYVWGDEFKAEEVFMNYFSNALNHLDGDRIVDIRLQKQEKNVRISVFNTGIPIPEESLPHLWEKFYKVDKARTREYGGSGVGLSIVKAIQDSIHQKYGVINYENGVEFWFEMELVAADGGLEGQKQEQAEAEH